MGTQRARTASCSALRRAYGRGTASASVTACVLLPENQTAVWAGGIAGVWSSGQIFTCSQPKNARCQKQVNLLMLAPGLARPLGHRKAPCLSFLACGENKKIIGIAVTYGDVHC